MIKLLHLAWDRLSLYLPVILMGVLALGTYWLVRSTPLLLLVPEPAAPARHEPDYFMRQFSIKTFDATGRLNSEVLGNDARHYPDTDTLEIDLVRIRSFNQAGRLTTASAQHALINADASELQLLGDARVLREPVTNDAAQPQSGLEFRSEFLHAYVTTERVESHKPVQLIRGRDQFSADAMEFDNKNRELLLKGRVRGSLMPGTVQ